jgi:hypothetical protein
MPTTTINLTGIHQLVLDFEGSSSAALTAPGVIKLVNELPIATTSAPGVVKPDGTTITVTPDGTITAVTSGLSVTVTLAPLTTGGTNGSLVFVNGRLTESTPST